MEERTHKSTCDADYLIKPKEEMLDDLVVTDNYCEGDTGVVIPKEELSNSLHLDHDLSEQKIGMVMPIKTELTSSDDIAQLRRQYESSGHIGGLDKDVSSENVTIEIKIEPEVTGNVYMNSMPVYDDPLLKECMGSRHRPPEKKELPPSDLNLHIKTHAVKKPYHCNLCPKEYTEKSSLTYHLRTHFGEKPFYCETCDKRFTQKSTLTDHLRTHTGEKPYTCEHGFPP